MRLGFHSKRGNDGQRTGDGSSGWLEWALRKYSMLWRETVESIGKSQVSPFILEGVEGTKANSRSERASKL